MDKPEGVAVINDPETISEPVIWTSLSLVIAPLLPVQNPADIPVNWLPSPIKDEAETYPLALMFDPVILLVAVIPPTTVNPSRLFESTASPIAAFPSSATAKNTLPSSHNWNLWNDPSPSLSTYRLIFLSDLISKSPSIGPLIDPKEPVPLELILPEAVIWPNSPKTFRDPDTDNASLGVVVFIPILLSPASACKITLPSSAIIWKS